MANFIATLITLIIKNVPDDAFRYIIVVITTFFLGFLIYNFQNYNLLLIKNQRYDYIRKMLDDYKQKNKSSYFSMQDYLGLALEKREMDYLATNNFYFLSKYIKKAYAKITFKDNGYELNHPILGCFWAVVFYFFTFVPVALYFSFFEDIKNILSHELFIAANIFLLPILLFLCIISFINLNAFGSAKCICKNTKRGNFGNS
jgi:hypothetical protein